MTFFVAIVGAAIGSFFNVVVARFDNPEGMFWGRSRCPHCKRTLAWYELVPVISFVVLTGRCRHCRNRIPWRYVAMELAGALVAVLLWRQYGLPDTPRELLWLVLTLGLVLLAYFDLAMYLLPDVVLLPLILITLAMLGIWYPGSIASGLTVGFLLAAGFGILYIVSGGRWIGLGDVKLIFLIGLAFGFPFAILIVVAAIWAATLVGLALLAGRRATMKTALPLGAFLASAALVYILWAPYVELFHWIFA